MNIRYKVIGTTVALGVAAFSCQVLAQTQPSVHGGHMTNGISKAAETRGYSRTATQDFITKAARANQAEIEEAHYVIAGTQNEQVKRFAQRMIDDHSSAGAQLKQVASKAGYTVPDSEDAKQRAELSKLNQEHGEQLSSAYSKEEVNDHEKVIAMFREASENKQIDPTVRDFARSTLPTLEQHLKFAEKLASAEGQRKTG